MPHRLFPWRVYYTIGVVWCAVGVRAAEHGGARLEEELRQSGVPEDPFGVVGC